MAGDRAREFRGVSIDTRTLAAGRPVHRDSRRAVRRRGVRGGGDRGGRGRCRRAARLERERDGCSGAGGCDAVVIEVDDTTSALQALAHAVRRESGTKVVAITGSAGKTTTKEVTAEFLAARYRVVRNRGNFNNHIGLPLSLIELRQRPEIAVVELGMNHAGEISTLVRVAEPDVRVWTNVGEAHLGFFASVDAIADAKAEILEGATPRHRAGRQRRRRPRSSRGSPSFAGRVVTFGIDRDADVRATDGRRSRHRRHAARA